MIDYILSQSILNVEVFEVVMGIQCLARQFMAEDEQYRKEYNRVPAGHSVIYFFWRE
jgi:hypothetical protein